MTKKIIGITLLIIAFCSIFGIVAYTIGLLQTLLAFFIAVFITGLILVGVLLISTNTEDKL